MSRLDALSVLLRREMYLEFEVSGPASLTEHGRAYELGYRQGHNDRNRSLLAWLDQGDVEAGLAELRDSAPLPRHWLAESEGV